MSHSNVEIIFKGKYLDCVLIQNLLSKNEVSSFLGNQINNPGEVIQDASLISNNEIMIYVNKSDVEKASDLIKFYKNIEF